MRNAIVPGLFVVVATALAGQIGSAQKPASTQATFSKDVAPILYKNCVACHQPDSMAPMSLLDYKEARPYARAIRAAVESRKMPPWFADPAEAGRFSNEMRLS